MICSRCRCADHLACETADCACGHSGSPVRPLTDVERQDVRAGRLDARVLPRETEEAR